MWARASRSCTTAWVLQHERDARAYIKKGAATAAAPLLNSTKLLFFCGGGFLFAIAGFDAAPDVLQHALGALRELPGGLQFKILVQGFFRAGSRNHLAGLGVSGGFVDQVHALLIVGISLGRVSRDRLVEGRIGVVHLSTIGQHRSLVVVVLRCAGGVLLGRQIIGLDRLVELTRSGFGLAQIVVIGSQNLGIIGFLAGFHVFLFELDRLLIIGDRVAVPLRLLRSVGLLGTRSEIGITQPGPEQIAGRIGLGGLIESGDRSFVVHALYGLIGNGKLLVQRLYGVGLFGYLGLLLLHRLELFRTNALLLGRLGLRFLQVEIKRGFIHSHRKASNLVQLLAILSERDLVLAGFDAQRKVLAFLVGLQVVLPSVVSVKPFEVGACDRGSLRIFADTLHRACSLGEHRGYAQRCHCHHQHYDQQTLFHFWASRLTKLVVRSYDIDVAAPAGGPTRL